MLLIDIGNSRLKAALGDSAGRLALPVLSTSAPDFTCWHEALAGAPPGRVLVSNVAGQPIAAALAAFVAQRWQVAAEFAAPRRVFGPMTTRYRNPAQLGVDRWLAALAAYAQARAPVCVIDAGTALTVDIVDAVGFHLGGLIAPGPDLMRRSLTRSTAQLASERIEPVSAFADNTQDAISLGCGDATFGLLNCVAERLRELAPATAFRWYLTGGAAPTVRELFATDWIEAPDLVLQGLALYAGEGA